MPDNRITIFDTTLRDGEQSPGFSMNMEEKLMVAELLDAMKVDVVEAGFAMASEGDFESVRAIAGRLKHAVPCSLARAKTADIERAAEALRGAVKGGVGRFRIHTFMSTSPIHLKYQFRMSEAEVLELIARTVALAKSYTDDVEWSAMDATRTGHEFLARAVETAIKAGATTINLPDTVGYATPDDISAMFTAMLNDVQNADKAIFSFHGQNDLGLATANTLAAIRAGARQAEVTINGIGERAGNTALEEVVMTLATRKDSFGVTHGVDTTLITRASRLVQSITGQSVQPNKAIVGANAFAHESGIHQDGMLKNASTYEIMTPESVGLDKSNLVMGKHSGRHAFKDKLKELGLELGDNALEDAFARFKALADKKKEIFDADIIALVDSGSQARQGGIQLVSLRVTSASDGPGHAAMCLRDGEAENSATVEGVGSADAAFKAIRALVPHEARLKLYQVHAVTKGTDAQAQVTVRLEAPDGVLANGHAAHTDTITASAMAYIDALNRLREMQAVQKITLVTQ